MNNIKKHPFAPFIPENIKVLIVGSFPGQHTQDDWYYGAKRNLFWPLLEKVYETRLPNVASKQELFTKEEIGIADLISECKRKDNSNLDRNLYDIVWNDEVIKSILTKPSLEKVIFTSQFVAGEFSRMFPYYKNTACLLSPSGGANIPISKSPKYKNYILENPTGNTITFRVKEYTELLKG